MVLQGQGSARWRAPSHLAPRRCSGRAGLCATVDQCFAGHRSGAGASSTLRCPHAAPFLWSERGEGPCNPTRGPSLWSVPETLNGGIRPSGLGCGTAHEKTQELQLRLPGRGMDGCPGLGVLLPVAAGREGSCRRKQPSRSGQSCRGLPCHSRRTALGLSAIQPLAHPAPAHGLRLRP